MELLGFNDVQDKLDTVLDKKNEPQEDLSTQLESSLYLNNQNSLFDQANKNDQSFEEILKPTSPINLNFEDGKPKSSV